MERDTGRGKQMRRLGGKAETDKPREETEGTEVDAEWELVGKGEHRANQGQRRKQMPGGELPFLDDGGQEM